MLNSLSNDIVFHISEICTQIFCDKLILLVMSGGGESVASWKLGSSDVFVVTLAFIMLLTTLWLAKQQLCLLQQLADL